MNPGGTNATDSTPMSPPFGRPELTTCLLVPPGAIIQMTPLNSSGAIRDPPNEPKLEGATASPPSLACAVFVITWTAPVQSIATTSVLPLTGPVARRRWSNEPVESNAIPLRPGMAMLTNEPDSSPDANTRVMPIGVCNLRMKMSSRLKSQPEVATCCPGDTARYASAPGSSRYPPGPRAKGVRAPSGARV